MQWLLKMCGNLNCQLQCVKRGVWKCAMISFLCCCALLYWKLRRIFAWRCCCLCCCCCCCCVDVVVVVAVGLGTGNARSQCGGDVSDAQKCLFRWPTACSVCVWYRAASSSSSNNNNNNIITATTRTTWASSHNKKVWEHLFLIDFSHFHQIALQITDYTFCNNCVLALIIGKKIASKGATKHKQHPSHKIKTNNW